MRLDKAGGKDKGLAGLILLTLVNDWCRREVPKTNIHEVFRTFGDKSVPIT